MTPRTHRTKRIAAGATLVLAAALVSGCSGGGDSDTPSPLDLASPPPPPPPPPPAPGGQVTISGTVTFESVPHDNNFNLDFDSGFPKASRGVLVEALNSADTPIGSDVTDGNGRYDIAVPPNTDVRIRVAAQMEETGTPSWNVRVVDNTQGDEGYFLAGSLTTSGTTNSTRDLFAPSGWTGNSVSGERAAAPFAILDGIYDAVQLILSVDPNRDFEDLQIYWSVDNIQTDNFDIPTGQLPSSFYTRLNATTVDPGEPTIAILGDANTDSDEYDLHVVAHEFGHFVEDTISRTDSIGGAHGLTDRLDPRLAFGEGFGNAFSGMVLNDSVYRDDFGTEPDEAFGFDLDINTYLVPRGWFNETSIQAILWDLYDSSDDGFDVISGGFEPIYEILTSSAYTTQPDFTTIFAFISEFRAQTSFDDQSITALLTQQDIIGSGPNGLGETNDGGLAFTLPLYKSLVVNDAPIQICSFDDNGGLKTDGSVDRPAGNKHGVRAFLSLNLATPQRLTFNMSRTSGDTGRDPDFFFYQAGEALGFKNDPSSHGISSVDDVEILTRDLPAGEIRIEAFDWCNTIDDNEGFGFSGTDFCNTNTNWGDSCYDFTVTD